MSKLFKFFPFYIFIFTLLLFMGETAEIISRFSFDISDDKIADRDRQKIQEALGRLAYSSFELQIQLQLLKEFQRIVSVLNSVFGEAMLRQDKFQEKLFFGRAIWALNREIKIILKMTHEPDPRREARFQELDAAPRKYFVQIGQYPMEHGGLMELKHWAEMDLRLVVDAQGHFIQTAEVNHLRVPFGVNSLKPVLDELADIMDAPAVPKQNGTVDMEIEEEIAAENAQMQIDHQQLNNPPSQRNIHEAGSSQQPQPIEGPAFFEDKGREELKKLIALEMTEKENLFHTNTYAADYIIFDEEQEIEHTERKMHAIRSTRTRFEGITKYVRFEQPAGNPAIKILQMEHEQTKDYANLIRKLRIVATKNLELIKQFVVNLKMISSQEKGNAPVNENENANLNEAERKEEEEKRERENAKANEVLRVIREQLYISRWGKPRNRKIDWLALEGATEKAFLDYTGHHFDRHHFGMVLLRQLLTEIGALKIIQNYVENRKKHAAKYVAKKANRKDPFSSVDFGGGGGGGLC